MGVQGYKDKQGGFAALEAVLILVVVLAIAGVGYYVLHSKNTADKTLSSTSTTGGNAPQGTSASVDQITSQDAKTETSVDNNADSSTQQDATSSNAAVSSLGGAYNEANY
jgi:uncharacterized protein (UPF0333 family)